MAEEKTVRRRRSLRFIALVALVVLATVFGLALLVNIFQRKQEARFSVCRLQAAWRR